MAANESTGAGAVLAGLPDTFTRAQALLHGITERDLYRLRDQGVVDQVTRGIFRRHGAGPADIDLQEVALRAPRATLCLTTALARHGLTDEIPAKIDVALPRGQYRPAITAPVAWHWFAPGTFNIGRTELDLGDWLRIGLYSPERSIVDTIRLRHREGPDQANAVLRRWLRRQDSSPATLLTTARHFPGAEQAIRETLEILL